MANYINKYADLTAYQADNTKQYPNVSLLANTQEIVYERGGEIDYSQQYFTTVALGSGNVTMSGSNTANTFSYSTDNGSTWSTPAQVNTVAVSNGDKVMWKGTATPGDDGIGTFTATTDFNAEGNIMSLLYGDNFVGQTDLTGKDLAFAFLFAGNTHVVSAANLILPATTLAEACYYRMFRGCTNLTTAPELPATTLASSCYASMFSSCESLTEITCLATNISATSCTEYWVEGVASTGTFTKASTMTNWTTGDSGIPSGWSVANA